VVFTRAGSIAPFTKRIDTWESVSGSSRMARGGGSDPYKGPRPRAARFAGKSHGTSWWVGRAHHVLCRPFDACREAVLEREVEERTAPMKADSSPGASLRASCLLVDRARASACSHEAQFCAAGTVRVTVSSESLRGEVAKAWK
jgi:hypothetical protein